MKAFKVMHKICLWILAVFFLLMALGSIPSCGTVLIMLFLAIAVMPIPLISRIWEKLPVRWVLKPIIILTVFLGAILLYEPTDMQTNISESQEEDIKEDTLEVSENSKVLIAESVSEEKTEKEPTDNVCNIIDYEYVGKYNVNVYHLFNGEYRYSYLTDREIYKVHCGNINCIYAMDN